jgi:hypothetical protein
LGRYSIHDDTFELMAEHVDLAARAKAYGLLAEHETVATGRETDHV